ncbi:MAG: ROK family protein [Gemmatimonadetes bacterium]|nr:ROK family protein [Gemmatimonadota bacterium]
MALLPGAVIGLDLGGTKLAGACFSAAGEIRARTLAPLEGRAGAAVGALICAQVRALVEQAGGLVAGVGVAVPGIYRAATGTVWAPNIPGWSDYPLVAELRAALPPDVTVRVDSDRACAILGEAWRGHARGGRDASFLVIGTGIGAGIMSGGRVLRGVGDAAGAIGWLALSRPYRPEYPAVGCFEYHASGCGIAAVARRLLTENPAHTGPLRAELDAHPDARAVFAAADAGDALAQHVLDEAVSYWGMAIANLVSLFNPERIILGGGVFGPAARLLDRIRAEAARWAQPISSGQVSIEVSGLGGDAVLVGAGALVLPSPVSFHVGGDV